MKVPKWVVILVVSGIMGGVGWVWVDHDDDFEALTVVVGVLAEGFAVLVSEQANTTDDITRIREQIDLIANGGL